MNQEDAERKEGQTKNRRKRSAFEPGQFVTQRLLRSPTPEAVGSNPALPDKKPIKTDCLNSHQRVFFVCT